jgi:hypothetical protein
MKKFLFLSLVLLGAAMAGSAQVLSLSVDDPNGPTNVRDGDNGKIVATIPVNSLAMLSVVAPHDGWWQIWEDKYWLPDEDQAHQLSGSRTGYWIHYSTLTISTRNYGGETLALRENPSEDSRAVFSFNEELSFRPIDIRGEWVKVKTYDGKYEGWIEEEWLCGNPLTNCC